MYKDKIEKNGKGIIYQYIGKDMVSTTEQIQKLYQEIQNIIPDIDFQLYFINDVFDEENDNNNYYVEIKYYTEISEETKKYIDLQLIKHISFKKVNK